MSTVRDIIRKKGNDVWSISPDATGYDAMQLMADKNAGALLVMTGDQVNGILSERDCVRKMDIQGRTSRLTRVSDIMTSGVISVQAAEKLEDCMATMLEKNSNGAVQQTIQQTPGAIGYVGLGYIDATVRAVPMDVDGTLIEPSVENVLSGEYPISRGLNMFTQGEPSGLAADFLNFIMSAEGQAIVEEEGFVPVA